MLILLNIGNTHTQIGYVKHPGVISQVRRCPTANFQLSDIPAGCDIAAATVVPQFRREFQDLSIFWVKDACHFNVNFSAVDFSTLGSDRIANVAALAARNCQPGLVIDCGTAVTFELLDSNGSFRGGAIAPGRALMNRALHEYTAQLPLVELEQTTPETDLGCNTAAAIQLGINYSLIGGVREFINRLQKESDYHNLKIVAIGGDAPLLTTNIVGIEHGGDDFTLYGILSLWELNKRCE